jgi:GDP-L-fucose synthase
MNMPIEKSIKLYVAGHRGMVGSAIVRWLHHSGYTNILTRAHHELDLLNQQAVFDFLCSERPDFIFIAAARVGGIQANNSLRGQFIYENLAIAANVVHGAYLAGTERLCFLGSSCIYPRNCPQPIKESYLLTGLLEETNKPYAIAKIAGMELCDAYNRQYGTRYFAMMPTNLYGPNDNYDLETSHVLPALIRKAHEAKVQGKPHMVVWGTGNPRREFLYVDDLAEACVFLMETNYAGPLVNIGIGEDVTIRELAETVAGIVGFQGAILFDTNKPDGTPRKLLCVERIKKMGWYPKTPMHLGIYQAYQDFLAKFA